MPRLCLCEDLVADPQLINDYEEYHRNVWPEILKSLTDCGILQMEIFRFGSRMCMIIDVTDDFTFERKAAMDAANPMVQKWEVVMRKYFNGIPGAKPGQYWIPMNKIFNSTW